MEWNQAWIFDLLCLAVLLVTACRYAKKGLLATIVEAVGTFASLLGARLISMWAAPQIFAQWFAPSLRVQVAEKLAQSGNWNLDALVADLTGFLPASIIQSVVEPVRSQLEIALNGNVESMTDALMTNLMEPLLVPIAMGVVFFLIFVVLRMVVGLLSRILTHVNGIPLIGTANKGLGLAAGAIVGLLYVFLVLCVLWMLIAITGGQMPYLNDALLTDSIFYRIFSAVNPFAV